MSIARKIGNVADTLDSAASGDFFAKGSADGQFQEIAYSSLVGTPTAIDSALTSQLIDSSYIQLRQTSNSAGLDSATTINLIDSSYVAARSSSSGSSGFDIFNYTATNNQTAFQDSSSDGTVLSYTENGILVYYNGLLLADEDFTATSGSSVVLASGADSGASLAIAKWSLGGGGGSSGLAHTGDRAIVPGGKVGGSNSSTIQYFDIATLGNASTFGTYATRAGNNGAAAGCGDGSRGLHGGGGQYGNVSNIIDYITIANTGNATDFGDLTASRYSLTAVGDATLGLFAGGYASNSVNVIDYVTVQTTGNATDFGDFTVAPSGFSGSANSTRAIFEYTGQGLDYITKATPGNAADFGNKHSNGGQNTNMVSTETTLLIAGGRGLDQSLDYVSDIYYINWSTLGNATDWGYDMINGGSCYARGTENKTGRGVFAGGLKNNGEGNPGVETEGIQYVTIAVPSNATDFGDLTAASAYQHSYSGT